MNREQAISRLLELKDEKYKNFHSKLIPTIDPALVIGVRVPNLRKLAKEMVKGDFRTYIDEVEMAWREKTQISAHQGIFYEEGILLGMIIAKGKMETEERLEMIRSFVPIIDNWATCDIFCSDLKFKDKEKIIMWDFLEEYLLSEKEYYIRFGVVMLIGHYIDETYILKVLELLERVKLDWQEGKDEHNIPYGYYAKMAVAWAVSVCYVKFQEQTLPYIKNNNLDDFTHNKAIQKIRESYRVIAEDKEYLKTLRR